jgi:hypothetical protein
LQDAAGIGNLAPQPERFTVMMLGRGPVVFRFGDAAKVGEDGGVNHPVAVGLCDALQQFDRVAEASFGAA